MERSLQVPEQVVFMPPSVPMATQVLSTWQVCPAGHSLACLPSHWTQKSRVVWQTLLAAAHSSSVVHTVTLSQHPAMQMPSPMQSSVVVHVLHAPPESGFWVVPFPRI
jgi:hypothetical protein